MLSFTMQVPLISTASQGMTVPFNGMTITSPGTRSVEKISSLSGFKERKWGRGGRKSEKKILQLRININKRSPDLNKML